MSEARPCEWHRIPKETTQNNLLTDWSIPDTHPKTHVSWSQSHERLLAFTPPLKRYEVWLNNIPPNPVDPAVEPATRLLHPLYHWGIRLTFKILSTPSYGSTHSEKRSTRFIFYLLSMHFRSSDTQIYPVGSSAYSTNKYSCECLYFKHT